MKVTILGSGTSTGIPVISCDCPVCTSTDPKDNRTRSSIMIEDQGIMVVIDTGPDFRQQMLREKVKDLDAVIFTHSHKDHIAGLDDIRPFNYLNNKPIDIYAEESVKEVIYREFPYAFDERNPYPGVPQIHVKTISNEPFDIKGIHFKPIRVMHYDMKVLGFRVKDFTYITDANFIEDEELEKIKGSEILVINGIQWKPHYSHFNVEQALEIIKKVQPKKAYLTHISHKLGTHAETEPKLPENVFIAYDGLKLDR